MMEKGSQIFGWKSGLDLSKPLCDRVGAVTARRTSWSSSSECLMVVVWMVVVVVVFIRCGISRLVAVLFFAGCWTKKKFFYKKTKKINLKLIPVGVFGGGGGVHAEDGEVEDGVVGHHEGEAHHGDGENR